MICVVTEVNVGCAACCCLANSAFNASESLLASISSGSFIIVCVRVVKKGECVATREACACILPAGGGVAWLRPMDWVAKQAILLFQRDYLSTRRIEHFTAWRSGSADPSATTRSHKRPRRPGRPAWRPVRRCSAALAAAAAVASRAANRHAALKAAAKRVASS